jgi:hypothetical protein
MSDDENRRKAPRDREGRLLNSLDCPGCGIPLGNRGECVECDYVHPDAPSVDSDASREARAAHSVAREFSELRALMSPDAQARVARKTGQILAFLALQELAQERGVSAEDLAERLASAEGSDWSASHQGDVRISALREVIEAMGGELRVVARYPDREHLLRPFSSGGE